MLHFFLPYRSPIHAYVGQLTAAARNVDPGIQGRASSGNETKMSLLWFRLVTGDTQPACRPHDSIGKNSEANIPYYQKV